MLDFSQFTFADDGTITGLTNLTDFGEEIAAINTPSEFPLGLFGQDIANSFTAASQGAATPIVTVAQTNRLLLAGGVGVAFVAAFFLLKNKAK